MRPLMGWILTVALLPGAASAAVSVVEGGTPSVRRSLRPNVAPVPYLVITNRQLQGTFMRLAQARTHGGLNAAVVTLEEIERKYPAGVDLVERVRLFLRDAYANWGTRWVLLGGDDSVVPIRRAHLRLGGILGDIDMPTDQYYAALDGTWNADGDGFWGESPGPGEPGDDVDLVPELFVGRAPVRTPAEAVAFVQRSLDYEDRLVHETARSALLAAEILGAGFDQAPDAEHLRPALEANPNRSIVRLYENSAAHPGSLQESRPSLLEALDGGFDLAVLLGAGGRGVILAGQDPVDRVNSEDMLGLTNAPHYPIVYAMSAYTTDPGDPLSVGNALMRAGDGGAAAVIGATDCPYVYPNVILMNDFFARALGPNATPIGEALAGAIAANATLLGDDFRVTTQGTMLLGDPALRIDSQGSAGGPVAAALDVLHKVGRTAGDLTGATLAITGHVGESFRSGVAVKTSAQREAEAQMAQARLDTPVPSLARTSTTMRFELPRGAAGAYALDVFDVSGRRVRAVARGAAAPGRFEHSWDLRSDSGAPVPGGIYFVRLEFAGTLLAHRVVVLR
jgi:hypothetical protein